MSYARQMLETYLRTFNVDADLLAAAIDALDDCAHECERHAHMPHCRICAEACRRCEQACRELLDALK